jgi:hypothetical protein
MRLCNIIELALGASASIASLNAPAQTLTAERPLTGYECMALNLSDQQMMDPSIHVPILANPTPDSPLVGYASATVIASIAPPTNGFQHVLRLDGVPGWVDTKYLKVWTNPGGNGQKCIPSAMSNGRLGFDFK